MSNIMEELKRCISQQTGDMLVSCYQRTPLSFIRKQVENRVQEELLAGPLRSKAGHPNTWHFRMSDYSVGDDLSDREKVLPMYCPGTESDVEGVDNEEYDVKDYEAPELPQKKKEEDDEMYHYIVCEKFHVSISDVRVL